MERENITFVVEEAMRLDLFLVEKLAQTRNQIAQLIEQNAIEINGKRYFETVEWVKSCPFFAITYFDGFLDTDEFLGRTLLKNAGRLHQKYKRCSTAIHNRHFVGANVDVAVVDTQAS